MEATVEFTFKLPIKLVKKRSHYVASCPILDVVSQGETEAKAKKNLKEALSLFFVSCFERGTLDAVLKQCGFKAMTPPQQARPKAAANQQDYINIPIPFLVKQDPHAACRA